MSAGYSYNETLELIKAQIPKEEAKTLSKLGLGPVYAAKFLAAFGSPDLAWAWAITGLTVNAEKSCNV